MIYTRNSDLLNIYYFFKGKSEYLKHFKIYLTKIRLIPPEKCLFKHKYISMIINMIINMFLTKNYESVLIVLE